MPEYLSPGVYIEETSYRAKSIQGVATSTAGFVGPCRSGPVQGKPRLITSFEEFRRVFGGLEDLYLRSPDGTVEPTTNYMAHAVKAFFDNGGQRVYIARIVAKNSTDASLEEAIERLRAKSSYYQASTTSTSIQEDFNASGGGTLEPRFVARSPGRAGNLPITVTAQRSGNLLRSSTAAGITTKVVQGLRAGDVVEVVFGTSSTTPNTASPTVASSGPGSLNQENVYFVKLDPLGNPELYRNDADASATPPTPLSLNDPSATAQVVAVQRVTLTVEVGSKKDRLDTYSGLSAHPSSPRFLTKVLREVDPEDTDARVYFRLHKGTATLSNDDFVRLLQSLISKTTTDGKTELTGGNDGDVPTGADYGGDGEDTTVTGLRALGDVDDIAIIAAPGSSAYGNPQDVCDRLITHCEDLRYRFAILSGARDANEASIRDARGRYDTSYAALYYPWVMASDPFSRTGELLPLPPEGFVAGIYARSDVERGVHKAPANEIVRGALRFSRNVNKGQQDTLNPEGINCLRYLEGRGFRVWGARTMSSDPEWMYVNVRRLFIYLEHSIDKSTQWAVFEPNNESLWLKVRLTIESFLLDVWRSGALMGAKPQEAFFVRCDRSTMTQSDLDNGRLIVLVGVAPTKPAEFVVFRVGQWTADASIL